MLPSETMIWQPEFTDKTLSRKPGAVQITIYRMKMKGGSDEQAQREAVTETAAALGFISAIGAVGGFFIPQAFGMSLNMTGSPVGAMKVFLIFYIVCVLLTWLVYGRRKFSQK
ncbi:hypothetical protein OkiPb00409_47310 [Escherichia coli]